MKKMSEVDKLGRTWQKKMKIAKQKCLIWEAEKKKAHTFRDRYLKAEKVALEAYNKMARWAVLGER